MCLAKGYGLSKTEHHYIMLVACVSNWTKLFQLDGLAEEVKLNNQHAPLTLPQSIFSYWDTKYQNVCNKTMKSRHFSKYKKNKLNTLLPFLYHAYVDSYLWDFFHSFITTIISRILSFRSVVLIISFPFVTDNWRQCCQFLLALVLIQSKTFFHANGNRIYRNMFIKVLKIQF